MARCRSCCGQEVVVGLKRISYHLPVESCKDFAGGFLLAQSSARPLTRGAAAAAGATAQHKVVPPSSSQLSFHSNDPYSLESSPLDPVPLNGIPSYPFPLVHTVARARRRAASSPAHPLSLLPNPRARGRNPYIASSWAGLAPMASGTRCGAVFRGGARAGERRLLFAPTLD